MIRSYREPTFKNLLKRPLVVGVPLPGLIGLTAIVGGFQLTLGETQIGNVISIGALLLGYTLLRIFSRFATEGWEESFIFFLERLFPQKGHSNFSFEPASIEISDPSTYTDEGLAFEKTKLLRYFPVFDQPLSAFLFDFDESGTLSRKIINQRPAAPRFRDLISNLRILTASLFFETDHIYSLVSLPATTDPLWIQSQLKGRKPYRVIVSIRFGFKYGFSSIIS